MSVQIISTTENFPMSVGTAYHEVVCVNNRCYLRKRVAGDSKVKQSFRLGRKEGGMPIEYLVRKYGGE